MSNGWGQLIVIVVGAGSMFGAWHHYDKYDAYTKATPRELALIGTSYERKETEKGQLSYLVGNFVEKETKREFQYPITQQTFDQYQETAKEMRPPVMGRPYVPRPPLRMELNLSERDINPSADANGSLGLAILLGIISVLCFFILT